MKKNAIAIMVAAFSLSVLPGCVSNQITEAQEALERAERERDSRTTQEDARDAGERLDRAVE